MIRKLILRYFFDTSQAKLDRQIAEIIARARKETKEMPSIHVENRIKELWKKEERKRFRIVK